MRSHPILKVLLLAYIAWGAWHWYVNRPVHAADGVLAEAEPLQTNVAEGEKVKVGRWTLTERAMYQVTAMSTGQKLRTLPEHHRRGFNGPWGEKVDARLHLDAWRRVLDRGEADYAS